MKTVSLRLTFTVRESNRRDGHCSCGAPPRAVQCFTTYGSTPLLPRSKPASFAYGDLGVNMDELWNADSTVSDRLGNEILRCEDDHVYVNPWTDVG